MKRKNEASWIESENRWYIKVQSNGVRKTFTSAIQGRKGKLEAEYKADEWLNRPTTHGDVKVESLYADFIEEMIALGLQTSQYRSIGKTRIIPSLGKRCISDVTEQDLQNILNKGYIDGQSKKSLSNIRGCITSFIKYARKRGCTSLRPMDLVIHKKAHTGEKRTLQPDEIRTVFNSDRTMYRNKESFDRYIYMYRFAISTGLRTGEVLGLQWGDIDENGFVSIKRSINTHGEITDGKNDNARRRFLMIPYAAEAIAMQKKMLQEEGNDSIWVFPYIDGTFTLENMYHRRWRAYAEYNGITKVSPYEMSRHTNISVNKDMPTELLKLVVGHSESMDTLKNYGHALDGELEKEQLIASKLFDSILSEK